MKRSTYATSVDFEPMDNGEFRVVVRWKKKDGTEGAFVREFTRAYAFGGTYTLTPNAWTVERRACDHARDIVRETLRSRGAL